MAVDAELHELVMSGAFIPALPLALDQMLQFDEQRQRALLRYYLNAGVDGIAAAVHTTQFEIREHPETFEALLALVAAEADSFAARTGKRILKIAGLCGTLDQAQEEATLADSLGYDAGLVSVSAYPPDAELDTLVTHYHTLAETIPLFGFYLQPAVGGRVLPHYFWRRAVDHPQVIGVKAAPFDRYHTIDVARAIAESGNHRTTALYTGNDDSIVFDLLSTYSFTVSGEVREVPVVGGLLGHWSVWAKTAVELFHVIRDARAADSIPYYLIQRALEITDANGAFFDAANGFAGCIAGIHEVLRRQGFFDAIHCYPDNGKLSIGQSEEIDRVYRIYPHLNDDSFVKANLSEWLAE